MPESVMPDDIAIEVHDLRKRYGDLWAVDGVDLDVKRGEVVAVLGPNGAGKTTTTEILEGYRQRDAGTVSVLGVDPAHGNRAWRTRLGIVLQSARDLGELTVAESVSHFAAYYPAPRDSDEVIDIVGLSEKRDARAGQLSGGQRRRLDVALGIIGRPEVLFLDEPTTGFDPEARRGFWGLIESLKAEGTSILLTTHYLDEAEALADRVFVIARGKVVAHGPPETLAGRRSALAVVSWSEDGRHHREETATPTALVTDISRRLGGEVPELSVTRPSLEDTYLELIDSDEDVTA